MARARGNRAVGGPARYTNFSTERLQVKLTGADPERYAGAPGTAAAFPWRGRRRTASRSARCALRRGSQQRQCTRPFRFTRHWSSTFLTPGAGARSAAVSMAWPIRAGAAQTPSRSTATKRKHAALPRFEARGHTPGAYEPAPETPSPEFPLTLDLRRPAGGQRGDRPAAPPGSGPGSFVYRTLREFQWVYAPFYGVFQRWRIQPCVRGRSVLVTH